MAAEPWHRPSTTQDGPSPAGTRAAGHRLDPLVREWLLELKVGGRCLANWGVREGYPIGPALMGLRTPRVAVKQMVTVGEAPKRLYDLLWWIGCVVGLVLLADLWLAFLEWADLPEADQHHHQCLTADDGADNNHVGTPPSTQALGPHPLGHMSRRPRRPGTGAAASAMPPAHPSFEMLL